jgi:hypothetical protein
MQLTLSRNEGLTYRDATDFLRGSSIRQGVQQLDARSYIDLLEATNPLSTSTAIRL